MTGKISFPWYNKGAPTELPDIPMAGDDELEELKLRFGKTLELQRRGFHLYRLLHIISVKRALDSGFVDKAQKAWSESIALTEPAQSRGRYTWPPEDFEENFNAYFHVEVEQRYNVVGAEQANEFFTLKNQELVDDLAKHQVLQPGEYEKHWLVTNLYWRYRHLVSTLTVDGKEEPFTKENLRRVLLWPKDRDALALALSEGRAKPSAEEERDDFLLEIDEDGIKKKSTSVEKPSRSSKTATPTTSDPGTALAQK